MDSYASPSVCLSVGGRNPRGVTPHVNRQGGLVAPDILVLCFHFGPSVLMYFQCLEIWGWALCQCQVAFFFSNGIAPRAKNTLRSSRLYAKMEAKCQNVQIGIISNIAVRLVLDSCLHAADCARSILPISVLNFIFSPISGIFKDIFKSWPPCRFTRRVTPLGRTLMWAQKSCEWSMWLSDNTRLGAVVENDDQVLVLSIPRFSKNITKYNRNIYACFLSPLRS